MNTAAPESPKSLKVFTSIVTAWRDARDALSALFVPALIAFPIFLALWIARGWIRLSTAGGVETLSYNVVCGVVQAFLLTPYAIAVHRFIILGEKTTSYRIALTEPRFRRFFGWSLALSMLSNAPAAISEVLPPLEEPLDYLLVVALGIPVFVLAIRAIVLFPAVAIDALGANWRQAIADTRGRVWRIFFILFGAMLPLFIVNIILAVIAANVATPISTLTIVATAAFLEAVGMLVGFTLIAVIASRLYQWIGVWVKGFG
jgi:hypothetical protein